MQLEISQCLDESAAVLRSVAQHQASVIEAAAKMMIGSYKEGHKVVFFGNGGSAADAQHLAAELVGRFKLERPALAAIALTTNTSILTALANDYGYERVFARQVEAVVSAGDTVVGISTSGNSPNVIAGLEAARRKSARTVGLLGGGGGTLAGVADISIVVPTSNTPRVQEAHIVIGHIICELVEKAMAQVG